MGVVANFRLSAAALALALATACASVVDDAHDVESFQDIIHSDLPLFRDLEALWPRHPKPKGDVITFGCDTRVLFGDWKLTWNDGSDPRWARLQWHGAFHCLARLGYADSREELIQLDEMPLDGGHFVELGKSEDGRELWAYQAGFLPGSTYTLFAAKPGQQHVAAFEVLARVCPPKHLRDAGAIDLADTRYCAINSAAQLLALARQMAKRPPLGIMTFVSGDTL